MSSSWWTGRRPAEVPPPKPRDAPPPAASEIAPAPAAASIAELAGQWRAAYAVAEAQERRLTAVEAAAASLYPGAEPGLGAGELIHRVQRDGESWWREVEAIDASLGLPALDAAANAAWGGVEQAAERLLALPPTTVKEAAIKFGILMTMLRAGEPELESLDRLHGFLEDLERLAAAEAAPH